MPSAKSGSSPAFPIQPTRKRPQDRELQTPLCTSLGSRHLLPEAATFGCAHTRETPTERAQALIGHMTWDESLFHIPHSPQQKNGRFRLNRYLPNLESDAFIKRIIT